MVITGAAGAIRRGQHLRVVGGGVAAAAGAAIAMPLLQRVGPLCPLRRLTGVPCPACGSTTAVVALATLRPVDAIAANPVTVAVVVVVGLWLVAAVAGGRWERAAVGVRGRLVALAPRSRPARWAAITPIVLGSWWWQLHRFDRL